ncbi:flagellar biosynthetic protein FliO [Pelagibius sp. Alg239-R121]|uniref:FliO/MopB family protein n=1 Tax=Pelagibius sp. Alg239-R121 TaxID=2993448 RepID=UPI0024A69358|nr:flagellar biosynthetic protein FliO [Pelagibius sp. Alg239-R121]
MEFDVYLRFLLALVFVLGLIGALTLLARRFGFGGQMAVHSGKQQRLSVSEVRPLDSRHKLVLVRRDNTEHLVLMGPTSNLVIENDIAAAAPQSQPPAPVAGAGTGSEAAPS